MGETRKVSGRGGWKQKQLMAGDRELNQREKTEYEKYCDYCTERVGCSPAEDYVWYVTSQTIVPRCL